MARLIDDPFFRRFLDYWKLALPAFWACSYATDECATQSLHPFRGCIDLFEVALTQRVLVDGQVKTALDFGRRANGVTQEPSELDV
jgi:hypothetical protein